MNLVEVIHQRWASATALNDLLPASRVFTGLSVEATAPYGVISSQRGRPAGRHNDGSALDSVAVRIEVFHDSHDDGQAVLEQIKAAFDRTDFALAGSDRVIDVQRAGDSRRQDGDGLWQFAIDFNCTVYLATGV